MSIRPKSTPTRIVCYVILPAAILVLSLRLYAQFRHVDVYVSRIAPMPAQLAAGLHMEEHKINPMVTIESRYDSVDNKPLSLQEIRRVRAAIAWSGAVPAFIDSLTIVNPTNLVARQNNKNSVREYELVKEQDRWTIVRATRQPVCRANPEW